MGIRRGKKGCDVDSLGQILNNLWDGKLVKSARQSGSQPLDLTLET